MMEETNESSEEESKVARYRKLLETLEAPEVEDTLAAATRLSARLLRRCDPDAVAEEAMVEWLREKLKSRMKELLEDTVGSSGLRSAIERAVDEAASRALTRRGEVLGVLIKPPVVE